MVNPEPVINQYFSYNNFLLTLILHHDSLGPSFPRVKSIVQGAVRVRGPTFRWSSSSSCDCDTGRHSEWWSCHFLSIIMCRCAGVGTCMYIYIYITILHYLKIHYLILIYIYIISTVVTIIIVKYIVFSYKILYY